MTLIDGSRVTGDPATVDEAGRGWSAGEQARELVAQVDDAVRALHALGLEGVSADDRAEVVRELDQVRRMFEARVSRELFEFATVQNLREVGTASMSGWLVAATGTTRRDAGRRASLANTLAELPLLADATAEGEVPVEAARVISRALNCRTRQLFDVFTQAMFVDAAKHKPLDALATDVERWLESVDPDGAAPDDPTTDTLVASPVGDRVRLRGDLSQQTGIPLLAALDEEMAKLHATESTHEADPEGSEVSWRPMANRRAEALAKLVSRGAAAPDSTTRREPAFIVVDDSTEDTECYELPGGGFVPVGLARHWALDADRLRLLFANAISGEPARFVDPAGNLIETLDLGRTVRFANRAQRRALAARDGGCAFPGCDRHHRWCDAHHIIWWENGGRSDFDNFVLLCRFHHTLIHAGLYSVEMVGHRPVFRISDPDHPDLTGPIMRDTWHRHPPDGHRRRPRRC